MFTFYCIFFGKHSSSNLVIEMLVRFQVGRSLLEEQADSGINDTFFQNRLLKKARSTANYQIKLK